MLKEPTTAQVDKATEVLHSLVRHIWRDHGTNMLPYIATNLGAIVGDLQRQSQKVFEGRRADMPAVGIALGHLTLSSLRWIGELDLNPVQTIRVAAGAQRRFADDR